MSSLDTRAIGIERAVQAILALPSSAYLGLTAADVAGTVAYYRADAVAERNLAGPPETWSSHHDYLLGFADGMESAALSIETSPHEVVSRPTEAQVRQALGDAVWPQAKLRRGALGGRKGAGGYSFGKSGNGYISVTVQADTITAAASGAGFDRWEKGGAAYSTDATIILPKAGEGAFIAYFA